MLRAFDLIFKHRWIYLFELVQNALDAGARSIALRLVEKGNALIFQHDGCKALQEKDIKGLSKVFCSTKSASTVGFMGIGFKSVFGRFREARISGWDWTFRFEVSQVVGEKYGEIQPDLLGAVTPIWDHTIAAPESGFTTRFEMHQLADPAADLHSDLKRFLPDDDRTPLAILADAGLKKLELDGRVWELGVINEHYGSLEATALSEEENLLWQLFRVKYQPSTKAIRCFLEHRKIQVDAGVTWSRNVLGVLPLDDGGMPIPPTRGRVYAVLPTEVRVPFGLHINADWLLNISRTGLREIEDNPWQREILDRIADVLKSFLRWVTVGKHSSPEAAKTAFKVLVLPSQEQSRLEALFLEEDWLSRLRELLGHVAVLPVWTEQADTLAFAKPNEIIAPPLPLAETFESSPTMRPAVLMKGPVLAREVLGDGARELLERIGFLNQMEPRDLEQTWAGGLEYWWQALIGDVSDRRKLLFILWSAVAELTLEDDWADTRIPCIRMDNGAWLPIDETAFFNELLPTDKEPGGPKLLQLIQSTCPETSHSIKDTWISALRQAAGRETQVGPMSRARMWIEEHSQTINLKEAIETAMESQIASPVPDWSGLIPLGQWAKYRNRPDLLTHVRVESENGPKCVPASEALVADPYVERGRIRRILFPTISPISNAYMEQDPTTSDAREWRELFEKAGARGALKVRPLRERVSSTNRERVAEFLGRDLADVHRSNPAGYTLSDFDIDPDLPGPNASHESWAAIAPWLEDGFSALRRGLRKVKYHYYGPHNFTGERPSTWVVRLSELAWVPCEDKILRLPKNVLPEPDPTRQDVPVAKLSRDLVSALDGGGVKFGASIPEAAPLRRLLALGDQLGAVALAELLRECREQIATDVDRSQFNRIVRRQLKVPSSKNWRIPIDRIVRRVGSGQRGALGGWILPLTEIDESLREELEHPEFPYEFPENTTGEQALAYLCDVWTRARSSPERLAN